MFTFPIVSNSLTVSSTSTYKRNNLYYWTMKGIRPSLPDNKRFPEDFMFQLTKDECLRSQIATLNEGRGQHLKYMPYVFTENGVAMLSSVLRSDPDGCGDYYTNKGICLGTDKKNNNSRTPLSSSNL